MLTTKGEDYYTQQHALCCKHLVKYGQSADARDLHKVRVCIKKIKAVFSILHEICGLDIDAYFSGYRTIFRRAGQIRSASLIAGRLKELSSDRKAYTQRKRNITVLHRKMSEDIPLYLNDINQFTEDIMAEIRACQFELTDYLGSMRKKLRKKWLKTNHKSNFHSLRKHLKQYLYAASLLERTEQKALIPKGELKAIDKLQDLIGAWHDDIDMSARIFSDVHDAANVEQTIRKEGRDLRKKIIKTGDELWR